MRILVVGGTQFIGPAVATRLDTLGHAVTVVHRGQHEAELPTTVGHLHGDRSQLDAMREHLVHLAPEVVVDMAAYTEQDAAHVITAVRGIARRIVIVSSQDVYRAYGRLHQSEPGIPDLVPLTEDAPLRERSYPYRGTGRGLDDYDKILVERVESADPSLAPTILRLPMVYGERDTQHRIALELRRMDDGRPAIFVEERLARWRWTRDYVGNVASAIALAATDDRAIGRTYNVGEPEAPAYGDWLRAIGAAAGWTGEVVIAPDGTLPEALRPPAADYSQHLVADTSRIQHELGFLDPVPRHEALLRTIAWERSQPAGAYARPIDYSQEDALVAGLARLGAAPQQESSYVP